MTGWTPPALPAQWTWTADAPPWVGRRRELETLEAVWEAVEHGARQLVFIAGEAGAGKSRLVIEVANALRKLDVPVLVGHCNSELGLPFDPLVSPVRSLLAALDSGLLDLPDGPMFSSDDARDLLRRFTSGGTRDAVEGRAGAALAAVVASLSAAAASGPLAVVLEDLHWAGESGLRALRYVVERTSDLPILFLATHRDSPPDASEPLGAVAAELRRLSGVRRIDIGGLTTADVSEYLTARGAGQGQQVLAAAQLLTEHTGGNPFLLGEVWRELQGQGGLEALLSGKVPVPSSLQAVVRSRLARLAAAEREVVRRGAVIGGTFDVSLVHASGSAPSLDAVYRALDAAAAVGLVSAVPEDAAHYAFPHALAQQAVLEDLTPIARGTAHAEVGLALERGRDPDDPLTLLQLAHHFAHAVGPGTADRARGYLQAAAEVAMNRLANSDAATLFQRAADLATDETDRSRLVLRAADCYLRSGMHARARELYEDIAMSGSATLRLEAAIGFEEACWRTGVDAYRAVEVLRERLEGDSTDDPPALRVSAVASLGRALSVVGWLREGDQMLEEALRSARALGDPRVVLDVLRHFFNPPRAWDRSGIEQAARQRERAAEAFVLASDRKDHDTQGLAAQYRADAAYVFGDADDLKAALADVVWVAKATRDPFWHWRSQQHQATALIMRCEFAAAAAALADFRQLVTSLGQVWEDLDGPWSLQTFALRRETGRLEFARPVLQNQNLPTNAWLPGLVAVYAELGLNDQARACMAQVVPSGFADLRASAIWPATLALLADAAAALADEPAAEALIPELELFSGLNLMASEFLAAFGAADRYRAELLGVLGRGGVEDLFEAALHLDTRMGSTLHIATTHAEWAAWLRRTSAPSRRVDAQVAAARQLADRHSLVRVDRILRAPPLHRRPRDATTLTSREVEVLRLIARGHSNREIAAHLFLSEHTAANHVRSILMKTQAPNRTAAVHHARQHGLLGEESDHPDE